MKKPILNYRQLYILKLLIKDFEMHEVSDLARRAELTNRQVRASINKLMDMKLVVKLKSDNELYAVDSFSIRQNYGISRLIFKQEGQ
jgi:DNA-binding MarR family transcriptional regulator